MRIIYGLQEITKGNLSRVTCSDNQIDRRWLEGVLRTLLEHRSEYCLSVVFAVHGRTGPISVAADRIIQCCVRQSDGRLVAQSNLFALGKLIQYESYEEAARKLLERL